MARKPHADSTQAKGHADQSKKESDDKGAPQPDRTPRDFAKVGPRSIEGVEASDLPDKGRGSVDNEIAKVLGRKLPQQTGAIEDGTDVGIRGTPDVADAEEHGHRGRA